MRIAKIAAKGVIVLGILGLSVGCATMDGRPSLFLNIPPSSGDGVFHNISWRYPWPSLPVGLAVPGYSIEFPGFDLSSEFSHEYTVGNLHDIGQDVGVYLGVIDPMKNFPNNEQNKLQGEFEFAVFDSSGKRIAYAKQPFGKYVWSTPLGIPGVGYEGSWGLYSLKESFFSVRKGERYRIRIHYKPDPALQGGKGFVYLLSGGSI